MAIDNIAAVSSPLLTDVGFSGLTGFFIGFAIKKVMKILAVGAGIFFAARRVEIIKFICISNRNK